MTPRGRIATLGVAVTCAVGTTAVVAVAGPTVAAAAAPPIGWNALRSGTTSDLNAVSFTDSLHGHAVGAGGIILATADGGGNWTRQYACAASTPCLPASRDRITNSLLAVSFVDAFHGWATGTGGTILATADGGATWTPQLACQETSAAVVRQYCKQLSADRVTADLHGVSFVDASHGWAVGAKETILATSDGGQTWVQQIACLWGPADAGIGRPCPARPDSSPPQDLRSVSFIDDSYGMVVGKGGFAVATADGGQAWTRILNRGELTLHSVTEVVRGYPNAPGMDPSMRSSTRMDTAHAVGMGGSLLISGGKGAYWYGTPGEDQFISQPPASEEDLNGVAFCDRLNGVAVGDDGTIERTTDEGVAWHIEPSGTSVSLRGVSLPDANDAFVVGNAGVILALHTAPIGLAVIGVSTHQLSTGGGLPVTITGKGFTAADEVSFGKAWAAGFSVDSDGQITAVPPPLPAGSVHVAVSARGMTSQEGDANLLHIFSPGGGAWTSVASCPTSCDGSAVRLRDGRVLVVGGHPTPDAYTDIQPTDAGAIFDPRTSTWTAIAPMHVARMEQSATLLADGRVLVAGGWSPPGQESLTANAEIYDPATGRWTLTGPMSYLRYNFSMVLLPNGRVLAAGGGLNHYMVDNANSAELFDPRTGRWSPTGSMHVDRAQNTLLLLRTGKVLTVGSNDNDPSAELYDPATGRWTPTGSMVGTPRTDVTATLLADGQVLVSGGRYVPPYPGRAPTVYPFAEVYDPTTGAWQPTGPMVVPRYEHEGVALPDGRVVVVGGAERTFRYCPPCDPLSDVEIYDPISGSWSQVTPAPDAESSPVAVLLGDGSVLVTGADGATAVFHPGQTPAEAAMRRPAWLAPVIGAALAIVLATGVVLALLIRRRRRPPNSRPPRATLPRHRPAVGAR